MLELLHNLFAIESQEIGYRWLQQHCPEKDESLIALLRNEASRREQERSAHSTAGC